MARGQLLLLLHAHLPELRLGGEPRAEALLWFQRAVAQAYLPLIERLLRLAGGDREGLRLSLAISPTLASQLRDPLMMERCAEALGGEARALWEALEGDLVGAVTALCSAGVVELVATPATSAALPLVRPAPLARAQVALGLDLLEIAFGHRPRGLLLPGGGLDPSQVPLFSELALEAVFAGERAVAWAEPPPQLGVKAPLLCAGSRLLCFGRDPESLDLMSSPLPGEASLEPAELLGRLFEKEGALSVMVLEVEALAPGRSRVGLDELEGIIELVRGRGDLELVTASDVAARARVVELGRPAASFWGEGDGSEWVGEASGWLHKDVTFAGRRLLAALGALPSRPQGLTGRAADQALAELLLAQASDWAWLIEAGPGQGYARERVLEHLDHAGRLAEMLETGELDEAAITGFERGAPLFSGVDGLSSIYCSTKVGVGGQEVRLCSQGS